MAKNNQQTLRIIAGDWRGRRVRFADSEGLRPTGDRIRETLFNWLAPYIAGARCLDAFSGSGALAFEALSRGAAHVTAIDNSPAVTRALEQAAAELGAKQLEIIQGDSSRWLAAPATQAYDLVFLDPPFRLQALQGLLDQLASNQWLATAALVYYEQDKSDPLPTLPDKWSLLREKTAGAVRYGLISTQPAGT